MVGNILISSLESFLQSLRSWPFSIVRVEFPRRARGKVATIASLFEINPNPNQKQIVTLEN